MLSLYFIVELFIFLKLFVFLKLFILIYQEYFLRNIVIYLLKK